MSEIQHCVQYGATQIEYSLSYAPRRTLAISVHPDLRVTVIAPPDTPLPTIEARLLKRAPWILRQQRELETYLPHTPPRQYVSGETHRYLGRQYRLKVIEDSAEWVKLDGGYLIVQAINKSDTAHIQALVDGWYTRQAHRILGERVRALLPRFSRINLPDFRWQVQPLQALWGNCTRAGTITFNLKLMQVPKKYIDYIIVHEMCHLIEHNHSKRFYHLLDHLLPNWKQRKKELNQYPLG
jgi:predicted metal-dependent hydrolase